MQWTKCESANKKLSFWGGGGGEIKKFLFSLPFFREEKIKKKIIIFTPVLEKEGKYTMTGSLTHFPIGMGNYHFYFHTWSIVKRSSSTQMHNQIVLIVYKTHTTRSCNSALYLHT